MGRKLDQVHQRNRDLSVQNPAETLHLIDYLAEDIISYNYRPISLNS
jgi:hypothetical protein